MSTPQASEKKIDRDVRRWLAALDRFATEPFMPDGRDQPPTPTRDDMFD